MSTRHKLLAGLWLFLLGYVFIGSSLSWKVNHICQTLDFEGGTINFTLTHPRCHTHKHYMGHYIHETYTIDGIFLR
jgi:hypothetical protein